MSGPYKLTGRETSYMPQLTIVILQYRPDAVALRRTLASLAMQDTRDFAVVLGTTAHNRTILPRAAPTWRPTASPMQTAKLIPNGGTVKRPKRPWHRRHPLGAHALAGRLPL